MNVKPGFTILEILMGIVLFSLIGGVLFQSMGLISKVLKTVNFFISGDMRSAVVVQLLERDLAGACVPQIVKIEVETIKNNDQKKEATEKKDSSQEKKVLIPHLFTYEHDEQNNLSFFSFITTNPTAEYATAKKRPVRVIYTLSPDKEYEGAFVLNRQETVDFMNNEYTQQDNQDIRKVAVVSGIKKCTFEFIAFDVEQQKDINNKADQQKMQNNTKDQQQKNKKKFIKKIVKYNLWNANTEEPEERVRTLPLIPEFVHVSLSFVHTDSLVGETVVDVSIATLQSLETITLEDVQPVSSKSDSNEKVGHLFDEERLSESLGDKLNAWTNQVSPS